jgi:hypothetical protein
MQNKNKTKSSLIRRGLFRACMAVLATLILATSLPAQAADENAV